MLEIFRDTLATSRYSYYGINDEEDLEDAINDKNRVINPDLIIESQATSYTNTTRLSTLHHNTILDAPEDDSSQSEIQNRYSQLAALCSKTKKAKVTGLRVIADLSKGLRSLADAFKDSLALKDTVDSTIQG